MTSSNLELIPNQVLMGERNYEAAIDLVIASAQSELLIFDADLSRGAYGSLNRLTLISQFLACQPQNRLTMILLDAEYFVQNCPRLFDLLKTYSHKITIYKTNEAAKVAQDCFVLADKQHYIRRFNKDLARFKFAFDDAEMGTQLNMRFNELLEETTETISHNQLGL